MLSGPIMVHVLPDEALESMAPNFDYDDSREEDISCTAEIMEPAVGGRGCFVQPLPFHCFPHQQARE